MRKLFLLIGIFVPIFSFTLAHATDAKPVEVVNTPNVAVTNTPNVEVSNTSNNAIPVVDYTIPITAIAASSPSMGYAPLEVQFSSRIAGGTGPINFEWDFGESVTSSSANPTYTYANPGNYLVTLIATDSLGFYGVSTLTIKVNEEDSIPELTVVIDPLIDSIGKVFSFSASTTTGNQPLIYYWEFGDGSTSKLGSAYHTYSNPGAYVATVMVKDANGDIAYQSTVISVTE